MKHEGQCLCGAVKVVAEISDPGIHACHCNICRTWSSSPLFGVNADAVEITGESNVTRFASSEWAERGFCQHCGTSLFYHLNEPGQYILCSGIFNDQSVFRLTGEIFVDQNPGGYAFAGDHPRLTGDEFMASLEG